ncbi:DUF2254 domain-containing protein [Microvirga makkahensis]|uniref:DUF2254 domain-containing protein n=1 Tax=Microvirga makkahensis TaxID=1128670 RepID=A0A7X3MSR8_9HYPH|nr:DUF2254 domain-containing protein [Microvirga makkahensis]MXQ12325.1 DUF2254 domain-containing protein [Microvirga makkahensis]
MWNWFLTTWDYVRTSLWFIPSIMIVVGVGLAIGMLQVDAGVGSEDDVRAWWINSGDGEDARNLLSTLLSAIITMASMAFSVTVVALTLAANAYGSRLIRIFRADLRTQFVLGLFAMTIVYCLIVLRSIHGKAPIPEVPHTSVTLGTALALGCVLGLLAFIQGVARSIVADEVVRRVRKDVDKAVAELPELTEENAPEHAPADLPADFNNKAARIPLPYGGYVQAVDYSGILSWAERHDAILHLEFRAGDFIVSGDRRVHVYPAPPDPGKAREEIGKHIVSGDERTPVQDLEFAIRHLVEVAVRALSPGINDPFTATVVIDRLRGALSRLMSRRLPPETLRDPSGKVRIYRQVTTYEGILDAALHQIRQAGSSHPAILIHMLEALARMAEHTRLDEQRRALIRHANLIRAAGERDISEPADREDMEQSFRRAIAACEAPFTGNGQVAQNRIVRTGQ